MGELSARRLVHSGEPLWGTPLPLLLRRGRAAGNTGGLQLPTPFPSPRSLPPPQLDQEFLFYQELRTVVCLPKSQAPRAGGRMDTWAPVHPQPGPGSPKVPPAQSLWRHPAVVGRRVGRLPTQPAWHPRPPSTCVQYRACQAGPLCGCWCVSHTAPSGRRAQLGAWALRTRGVWAVDLSSVSGLWTAFSVSSRAPSLA